MKLYIESFKKNIIEVILYNVPTKLHSQIRQRNPTPDLDQYEEKAKAERLKSDSLIRTSNRVFDEDKELVNKKEKPTKGTRGAEALKKYVQSNIIKRQT